MKLNQLLRWTTSDGKHLLMRIFYYTYIPIILILGKSLVFINQQVERLIISYNQLGYKSMNIQALFPQLASKQ